MNCILYVPCSVFRVPCSVFRVPCSVFRVPVPCSGSDPFRWCGFSFKAPSVFAEGWGWVSSYIHPPNPFRCRGTGSQGGNKNNAYSYSNTAYLPLAFHSISSSVSTICESIRLLISSGLLAMNSIHAHGIYHVH